MKTDIKEAYITEIKAKVKRAYRGTKRGRTDTGQRANPIELKPEVTMIGKDMKR